MKYYLVKFNYDHYCQGYETETHTSLVGAESFKEACTKIEESGKYEFPRDFINLTIE